jgi:hypothetical protein
MGPWLQGAFYWQLDYINPLITGAFYWGANDRDKMISTDPLIVPFLPRADYLQED